MKQKLCPRALLALLMVLALVFTGCGGVAEAAQDAALEVLEEALTQSLSPQETQDESLPPVPQTEDPGETLEESGSYSSRDEVALYLHLYGHLPDNFITKQKAKDMGWDSQKGNLWEVAPGMSIGGDRFGNYEELLPVKDGRKYYECDIDYEGGFRGGKRIVFSNDGLIYYTEDHYESFELLYGRE